MTTARPSRPGGCELCGQTRTGRLRRLRGNRGALHPRVLLRRGVPRLRGGQAEACDLVCMWDTVEHPAHPVRVVEKAGRWLRPGGRAAQHRSAGGDGHRVVRARLECPELPRVHAVVVRPLPLRHVCGGLSFLFKLCGCGRTGTGSRSIRPFCWRGGTGTFSCGICTAATPSCSRGIPDSPGKLGSRRH